MISVLYPLKCTIFFGIGNTTLVQTGIQRCKLFSRALSNFYWSIVCFDVLMCLLFQLVCFEVSGCFQLYLESINHDTDVMKMISDSLFQYEVHSFGWKVVECKTSEKHCTHLVIGGLHLVDNKACRIYVSIHPLLD